MGGEKEGRRREARATSPTGSQMRRTLSQRVSNMKGRPASLAPTPSLFQTARPSRTSSSERKEEHIGSPLASAMELEELWRRRSTSHRQFLQTLPSRESCLKYAIVEKKIHDGSWQRRQICLTSSTILFGREDSEEVIDDIDLVKISSIVSEGSTRQKLLMLARGQGSFVQNGSNLVETLTQQLTTGDRKREEAEEDNHSKYEQVIIKAEPKDHVLRFEEGPHGKSWVSAVREAVKTAKNLHFAQEHISLTSRLHRFLVAMHGSNLFSGVVFALILVNYVLNVLDFQFRPEQMSNLREQLDRLDQVFTVLFAIEVTINLIVHWFWPFWYLPKMYMHARTHTHTHPLSQTHMHPCIHESTQTHNTDTYAYTCTCAYRKDVWNLFDVGVMAISIYGLTQSHSSVSWLRIFRVLRVVRIVRRLSSLRTIMNSISHAAMPVLNAFCLVALVWGVFAVLAVQLYSDISVRTDFGYFDTFTEALQTLFQVFPLHIAPDLYCSHLGRVWLANVRAVYRAQWQRQRA